MGIHLSITNTVLPLFTMLFQKFVVSLTQFIYFVQTKIQILLYKIILSGGQLSGGQLSGGQLSPTRFEHIIRRYHVKCSNFLTGVGLERYRDN